MKLTHILILLFLFGAAQAFSNDIINDWSFFGNLQMRTELDGRDFSHKTSPVFFTSLRTRLAVQKTIGEILDFFVQIQDSRIFGEEPNTLSSIGNLDLHQGYVKLRKPFELPVELKGGRFELSFGSERFFGPVGWHYIGRSFDGATLTFDSDLKIDLFFLVHNNNIKYIGNATPAVYQDTLQKDAFRILGLWLNKKITSEHSAEIFGYYENNNKKSSPPDIDLNRFTTGINYSLSFENFKATVEAAYQAGQILAKDISAYIASIFLKYQINSLNLGAGFDILSGDNPEIDNQKINTFTPAFHTGHKFYGYMDYFINIPQNTSNLGLNDFYLNINYSPQQSKFQFDAMFHHFLSNQKALNDNNIFGQEIDLTVIYNFITGTKIQWGGSLFIPGNLIKQIFGSNITKPDDTSFWTYIMIAANI
jgi:hypothetical protein